MPAPRKTRGQTTQAVKAATIAANSKRKTNVKKGKKNNSSTANQRDEESTTTQLLQTIVQRLEGMDSRLNKVEEEPKSPPSTARASSKCKGSSLPTQAQAHKVRKAMSSRLNSLQVFQDSSSPGSSSSEADTGLDNSPTPKKHRSKAPRKKLKSGRVRSANSHVKVKTTWPHEVMYDRDNSAADFDKLTLAQFVRGFTRVSANTTTAEMRVRNDVLEEIMEDADTHPWELVRSAHCVFLQQLETGRIDWHDTRAREIIRHSHIWIPAASQASKSTKATSKVEDHASQPPERVLAQPGDKTCRLYNSNSCSSQDQHPQYIHACQYCLVQKSRICKHPEKSCKRKILDQANQS